MDREDAVEQSEHRFRTVKRLLRTHAQGMAALQVEQQQTHRVIVQLVERANVANAPTRAVDTRLTTIADGVAERYENTLRDIGEGSSALETLACNASPPQAPPNYSIGSQVVSPGGAAADAAERLVPSSPSNETPWQRTIRRGIAGQQPQRSPQGRQQGPMCAGHPQASVYPNNVTSGT